MPRISEKRRYQDELLSIIYRRQLTAEIRLCTADDDTDEIEDDIDLVYFSQYSYLSDRRYIFQSPYRSRNSVWREMLYNNNNILTDKELLSHFQVTRELFWRLLILIKHDDVFVTNLLSKVKGPLELHLLVLLKFFGSCGNDATSSKHAFFLGVSSGSIITYVRRTVKGLLKLRQISITWPDENEWQEISDHLRKYFYFNNCIGIIDGTLFQLEFKASLDGEDYYTRICGYALHSLVLCDHIARIRYISLGWPGSVHDNRVWSRSKLKSNEKNVFFDQKQYLVGDSAFMVSSVMIPAFKKPFGHELDSYGVFFNTKLAKMRIKSEHCIGLLKARFQYRKRIRVIIKDKRSLRQINQYIMWCSITPPSTTYNTLVMLLE